MLGAAIAMGYLYQGPPFRLSYKGLGEPLCFAAFGPLATTAFYLCQVPLRPRSMMIQNLEIADSASVLFWGRNYLLVQVRCFRLQLMFCGPRTAHYIACHTG